ncbi:hypothetical protein DL769_003647 [Monosporascus sp. CRB-8-3]|nr:hypothetical protein DL769_003647 [Monosporascus sp. CRB-8-3]
MPKFRHEAPHSIPDVETLDDLLGDRSDRSPNVKTIHMLSPSEKEQTHLVTFGKRKTDIDGDPEGIWYRWAGNIAHPQHPRMGAVLEPIFSKLTATAFTSSVELTCIAKMLARIPKDDIKTIAKEESDDHGYRVILENDEEVTVCFCLGGRKVRLMQAFDIDVDLSDSYGDSNRTKRCEARTAELVPEGRMPINVQQYLMAKILKRDSLPHLSDRKSEEFSLNLRSSAQEQYWMQMSTDERQEVCRIAAQKHEDLEIQLMLVRANWRYQWINNKKDKDYFHQYVRDEGAAKHVLQLIDDDIFIVTDVNRKTIFANFEKLCDAMFSGETTDLLARGLDMWSFFVPLPSPESKRHVVDRWVRKIHPELDPERATVGGLPAAKMAVAHYGCWSMQTDPHGNLIIRTADSRCAQIIRWQESAQPLAYLPAFQKAVLGKTTEIIRFLLLSLDPGLYQEYCEVWDNVPEEQRVRHKDSNDYFKGVAGLCTFGDYTGGAMCIPQLGIKVPYRPGTHHDSCRQFVWRKLGRSEPAGKEKKKKEAAMRQNPPCINTGHDEDDLQWTNQELHGPGALPLNSSSSSSASTGSAENRSY